MFRFSTPPCVRGDRKNKHLSLFFVVGVLQQETVADKTQENVFFSLLFPCFFLSAQLEPCSAKVFFCFSRNFGPQLFALPRAQKLRHPLSENKRRCRFSDNNKTQNRTEQDVSLRVCCVWQKTITRSIYKEWKSEKRGKEEKKKPRGRKMQQRASAGAMRCCSFLFPAFCVCSVKQQVW